MALVLSQDSGLLHPEINFKAPQRRKQKTKELDDCNTLSIPPPPPPSTCLCARRLLIFEALSFVFVRCPKDYGMKRDR